MYTKKFQLNEVRWGILGAGNVCEVKSAPAMNLVQNSRLVAVMRRNPEKARDYAMRHGVPSWYSDADELIQDPDVNAIYIAAPPYTHLELTKKAAAAGKPVYVEKPMARTHRECLEMIAVCKKARVPLYVAYYRRRLPNFLKIKELIDKGTIGDIRLVQIQMHHPMGPADLDNNNWRVDPVLAGGGYFYDLASHQLDFLDFLFGPITVVKGISANQAGLYKTEDIVGGTFRFENGVLGNGSWCYTCGKATSRESTTIIGSKGEITYPTFGNPHFILKTDKDGEQRFDFQLPAHIQQPLIETVVQDLLGVGDCPSTGISGARTTKVLEAFVYG